MKPARAKKSPLADCMKVGCVVKIMAFAIGGVSAMSPSSAMCLVRGMSPPLARVVSVCAPPPPPRFRNEALCFFGV